MGMPGRRVRATAFRSLATVGVALAVLLSGVPARGGYPPLPPATYSRFLEDLAVPVATPGTTVTLTGTLVDPAGFGALVGVNLTLGLYGFNAYPGNATGPLPSDGAPSFADATSGSTVVTVDFGSLAPGGSGPIAEPIVVPSGSPVGAYAVRTQLSFSENGTPYLLESRGYFSYAAWTNATVGPNGTTTINLTRLGVSGILPETAVPVVSDPFPWLLAGLAIAAIVCAAAGGYYASRRGPGSRSGAKVGADDTSAPSALGKSRKSDGD